jgi:predicted dehydrogenase
MVGGGKDAFIGAVHRMAARMDGRIEFVCGALSSVRLKALESGAELLLPQDRIYGNYRDMFRKEAKLPPDRRMDFVAIVTPNNMHYPVSMAALDAGFHVVCEKPMTVNIEEARNLLRKLRQTGLLFCLTHNYTGYPMVKEARDLVAGGKLGKVRRVVVEYAQGWLATRLEAHGQKQAGWRTDPRRAGATCCMGDIGSHCQNLAEYVTGLEIAEVCADVTTFAPGRMLDDDGSVLVRFCGGGSGVLWASQIAVGEENALSIRVYCEKGSVEWRQQDPNTLVVRSMTRPAEIRRAGTAFVGKAAAANTRLPAGHPEGFIESFANIYRAFADALTRVIDRRKSAEAKPDYPDAREGLRGMAFLDAVVRSSKGQEKWVPVTVAETRNPEQGTPS